MAQATEAQSLTVSAEGDKVRRRRQRLRMDISELARAAGVNRDTVSNIEAGRGFQARKLAAIEGVLDEQEAEAGLPPLEDVEPEQLVEVEVRTSDGQRVAAVVKGSPEGVAEAVARLLDRMKGDTP